LGREFCTSCMIRPKLIILKSFGVDMHPRKVHPMFLFFGFLHLVIVLNVMLIGQLKVLLVYLVVGIFLKIIMLPLWVVSLCVLVFVVSYMVRWWVSLAMESPMVGLIFGPCDSTCYSSLVQHFNYSLGT